MARYTSRRPDTTSILIAVGILILATVITVLAVSAFQSYQQQDTRTITVCGKERVAVQDGNSEYRIYASDGTYVMKDNLIGGVRLNTADAYGQIKERTTYQVTIKGWRVPAMSAFENIIAFKKVDDSHQQPQLCD